MLTALGSNLQASDDYQTTLKRIEERVKEEKSPSLFVSDFGVFPTIPYSPHNVVPMSDFLQWEKDAKNIASVFRGHQRGDTKRAGTNSKEISILGSPQCFEAYVHRDDGLSFIDLGPAKEINVPNSKLRKALEYTGHCDSMNASHKISKSALALGLALTFDAAHEIRAATIWYQRSIQNGSTVVAPYYLATFLDKRRSNTQENRDDANRIDLRNYAIKATYKRLAETKGHLGSIRAFADLLERDGNFMEAAQWYKKAVLEKSHKPSIGDMIRCLDELWAPWSLEGEIAPDISLLQSIKELYELAAYKFGDEEAGNRLANLMKEYDYEREDDDCYYLEKEALAKQIALCPDKASSNIMLRLALLKEESYCMAHSKGKRDLNKIYDMFLPAAQAGNFAAMIKLYRLSSKMSDKDKTQFWSDKLECLYEKIFGTAKINDALLYLAYLEVFGEDLLEDACSELSIDSTIFKEAAKEYSFKPSVDFTVSGFPATEDVATLEHKRKREKDEIIDFERVIKKTKRKESNYNSLV
jgi:hypothetical protein